MQGAPISGGEADRPARAAREGAGAHAPPAAGGRERVDRGPEPHTRAQFDSSVRPSVVPAGCQARPGGQADRPQRAQGSREQHQQHRGTHLG